MTAFWRQVGMNYVQYSRICANVVRHSFKAEKKEDALKRAETLLKAIQWKDGKPIKNDV